ncbi:MAG: hypothetical protein JXD19_07265, partial [Deltaproteobacteria bacterium]|nr:hypothetical protein [Deltaproteobacteria bacterium]
HFFLRSPPPAAPLPKREKSMYTMVSFFTSKHHSDLISSPYDYIHRAHGKKPALTVAGNHSPPRIRNQRHQLYEGRKA